MKKSENVPDHKFTLRQKAEEMFSNKIPEKKEASESDIETLKLIHELEVSQIELEMQNEELRAASAEARETASRYAELYNLAPTGFFTLSHKGVILQLNRTGAQLLNGDEQLLKNKRFDSFVADDSKPVFNRFLYDVLHDKKNETCSISLTVPGRGPMQVHMNGIAHGHDGECLVNVVNLTEKKSAQEQLNEVRLHLQAGIESAQDMGILSVDKNYRYLYFNQLHKSMMMEAYGIEIKKGMNLLDCITNEADRKMIKERYDHALTGEVYLAIDDFGDSTRDYYETHFNPIFNDKNEVVGATSFSVNVTERVRAEQELIENRAKLETALASMTDAVFISDINGNFIEFNEAFAAFHRFRSIAECAQTFSAYVACLDMFLPEGETVPVDMWPVPRALRGEVVTNAEYILRRKDSDVAWEGSYSFSPIRDGDGEIAGAVVVARDITEQKESQKKLNHSEKRLNTLFDSMMEMVVMHELVFNDDGEPVDYRITDSNKAFTEIIGVKRKDVIGKLATEAYNMENAPYLDVYANVALTGEPTEFPTYFPQIDKHLLISVVSPHKNSFATIITDITSQQQSQELIIEKNKELENYLYIASHDLRSPLVNIQGFSQRLQKQAEEISRVLVESGIDISNMGNSGSFQKVLMEGLPKTLNFILTNVSKMDALIHGLLQISRTGRLVMSIKKVAMNEMMKKIIATYNFQITDLRIKVKMEKLLDCYGDENQLNQLFSNIIDNAIKYRDPERPLVIGIKSVARYNKVVYSISDTGKGIKSRYLDRIWDMFYRVDPTAPQVGEGVGLSLVKRIVNKHRGKIWVESEEGEGTTFFVELQKKEFKEL